MDQYVEKHSIIDDDLSATTSDNNGQRQTGGFRLSAPARKASVYEQDAQNDSKYPKAFRVIRGEQLSGILDREVCIDWRAASTVAEQLCVEISPLHRKELPLGELNAANIIVEFRDGKPGSLRLLTTARARDDDALFSYKETHSGLQHELFLSPEEKRNEAPTTQSDVYAIGGLMYACITGSSYSPTLMTRLFLHDHVSEALSHFQVSPNLVAVISRCLENDPRRRFRNVDELHTAIRYPIPASPPSFSRRRVRAIGALVAGVAVMGLAVCGMMSGMRTNNDVRSQSVSHARVESVVPHLYFNKPVDDYHFGDLVSVTIAPAQEMQKLFLFYIDDRNNVLSIYPSRTQQVENISQPVEISRIGQNSMFVNRNDGRFVLIALSDHSGAHVNASEILQESDWSAEFPEDHALGISATTLMQRLDRLQSVEPNKLSVVVQEAPRCSTQNILTDAGQP